jgi:hypothetical protein
MGSKPSKLNSEFVPLPGHRKSIWNDKGRMVAEIKKRALTMHGNTDVFAASNLDQPLFHFGSRAT